MGAIRLISGPHGVAIFLRTTPWPWLGRTSMSADVMPACSDGTSRKYQNHANTHTRLPKPSATNDPRHETTPISAATSGGVMELPMRENEWVKPCAKPRLAAGVQLCIARV